MKITLSNYILLTFCGILFIFSNTTNLQAQKKQAVEESTHINAHSAYIDGLAAFENEDYKHALELLKAAYVKLPDHPGVNYALADAYLMVGDIANAEYYGKQAAKLAPHNHWYRLKLARIYRDQGKVQTAISELKHGLEHNPNNTNLLNELGQAYSAYGKLTQANAIYNKLLFLKGEDLNIRLQKLRHFNELKMQDSAIVELQKIRSLDPSNLSTLRVLSNKYKEMGRMQEAKEVLQKALEINSRDPKTLIMLSNIYINETKWDSVNSLIGKVVTDSTVNIASKIELGRYLYSKFNANSNNSASRRTTAAVLQSLMQTEPNSSRAQSLAADFFIRTQQYDLALSALKKTTRLSATNDTAWKRRVQLLLKSGNTDEAIRVGEKAIQAIPQEPIILYLLGSAYLANNEPQKALPHLQEASSLPVRKALKASITASLGQAYASLNQWEDAFKHFEQSLKINPQNATLLNNYAYYLAVQNQQLDRAEGMARKALSMNPQNPSFLDTLGWVLYQQGSYKKAEKYVRASLDIGQASAEVMEHLGDILDKLGQTLQAKKWWRKAIQKDSTRTYLKDKISVNGD